MRYFLFLWVCLVSVANAESEGDLTLKQKILMPGPLVESHAEYEAVCENCHTPFSKEKLSSKCLDCHEQIAEDRASSSRYHGRHPVAKSAECKSCHIDHKGRDADITDFSPEIFEHRYTQFPLTGAHNALSCNQCHQEESPFRDTGSDCVSCHTKHDVHKGALGDVCSDCHSTSAWRTELNFDHNDTHFPLGGKHQQLACVSCHHTLDFQHQKVGACVDCHRAHDVHQGVNGNACADCHNESAWKELEFDHSTTRFPLTGSHANVVCQNCHRSGELAKNTSTKCSSCHSQTDVHFGQFGTQCDSCHTTKAWSEYTFVHNQDTTFPLTGKHQDLSCRACHRGQLDHALPRDCKGCHAGDDVHQDDGMALCATCHSTTSWKKTTQFSHDFTPFPLLGMHQLLPCQSCHAGNQFTLNQDSCYSCHKSDDIHKGAMGKVCESCHNANGWALWFFEHDTQTDFSLEGKHKGLACDACHKPGAAPGTTSKVCGQCHRSQDIHNGELGSHCGTCHGTDNFFELWLNQRDVNYSKTKSKGSEDEK